MRMTTNKDNSAPEVMYIFPSWDLKHVDWNEEGFATLIHRRRGW